MLVQPPIYDTYPKTWECLNGNVQKTSSIWHVIFGLVISSVLCFCEKNVLSDVIILKDDLVKVSL